jgi:hypothetical protein
VLDTHRFDTLACRFEDAALLDTPPVESIIHSVGLAVSPTGYDASEPGEKVPEEVVSSFGR